MSTALIILLFSVIALVRIVQKICHKESSILVNSTAKCYGFCAIQQIFAVVVSLIILLFVGFTGFDNVTLVCSIITGTMFALDTWTSIEVLKGCDISLASMFCFGSIIISVIGSYFIFEEKVSYIQLIGLILFFVSIFLLTRNGKKEKRKLSFKTFILLIISFLSNGFVTLAQKYFALYSFNQNTSLFSLLSFACSALFLTFCFFVSYLISKRKEQKNGCTKKSFIIEGKLVIIAAILAICIFLLNTIITEISKYLSAIVLFPTSCAIGIIFFTLVGVIKYKEKMSLANILGLIFGIISIAIISVFTEDFIASLF